MVNISLNKNTYYDNLGESYTPISIADETMKLNSLKLTAGFPFGEFEMPSTKFQCIKDKILNGRWDSGCKSLIESSYIGYSSFDTTFSIPAKQVPIIEGECFLEYEGKDLEWDDYRVSGFSTGYVVSVRSIADKFGIDLGVYKYIDNAYVNIFGDERPGDVSDLSYYYWLGKSDYNREPIKFHIIKRIIKTLQWFVLNLTPSIAYIENGIIRISNKVKFIDPLEFHGTADPIILNTEFMTKWKEKNSRIGFLISEPKSDYDLFEIEPIGDGVTYNLDNIQENMIIYNNATNSEHFLSKYLYNMARSIAKRYDDVLGSKIVEINTIETTPIVPYSKVQIEDKTYYCIEAEIPYKDYELFKYKLQEMK